jgi:hypothetical protein
MTAYGPLEAMIRDLVQHEVEAAVARAVADPDRLLTLEAAQAWASVGETTFRRWIAAGLPVEDVPGRGEKPLVRVRLSAMKDWLENRKYRTSPRLHALVEARLAERRKAVGR